LAIFYSQGYRVDFKRKKIIQTGAFFFKISPRGALIFLDGKLAKKTDFFGNAYIDNLLPKEYKVEIKKDGYLPWTKNLEVNENFATENKNIFLVPENPKFNLLEKEVDNFFVSPNEKKIVLKKNEKEGWNLTLLDLTKNTSYPLLKERDFLEKKEKVELLDLKWSKDSTKVLLRVWAKEEKYFIVEIGEKPNLLPLNLPKGKINQIDFSPKDSQKIFFSQELNKTNGLFSLDYKDNQIVGPLLKDLLTFEIFNNDIFWLNNKGFLYESDSSGNLIRQINQNPLSLNLKYQYQLFPFSDDKIFIKEQDNLYFLNQSGQSFEKVLEGVKEIKASSDSKKIVYFTENEIWVLFLKKIEDQPQKAENEKMFLFRFSGKIGDVFWWTNHYLIFNINDKIKISEIDDRDSINIYEVADFKNPKFFWNMQEKKLYLLSQGNLFASEKLIK